MRALAFLLVLGLSGAAWANDWNRSDSWLTPCKQRSDACHTYIAGFLAGHRITVFDAFTQLEPLKGHSEAKFSTLWDNLTQRVVGCIDDRQVTYSQLAAIWVKYIKDNPVKYDQPPERTLSDALVNAFPC